MSRWSAIFTASALGGFLILTGCKTQQPAAAPPSSGRALTLPPSLPATEQSGPSAQSASADSSDLLAKKTQLYAQEMEQMLAKQKAQQAAAATRPAVTPAANPPAESPSAAPPSSKPQPAAPESSAQDSTPPTANQTASLAPPSRSTPSANQLLKVPNPPSPVPNSELSADPLERRLLQDVTNRPGEVAPQLNYQLYEFIQGKSVPDMRAMSSLSSENRDVLIALLDALSNFRNGVLADNNMLPSRKIQPLLNLADRLREQGDLSLPELTLCRKVEGFGVYDPIEPARFSAGKEHAAIIYCEVANFTSSQDDKKMWQTKMSEQEVLYTESGLPVWPANPTPRTITDASHNRRHDFFIVKLIRLPATLSVGRYLLKVTVVDQQSNRMAEGTIPIEIVAE